MNRQPPSSMQSLADAVLKPDVCPSEADVSRCAPVRLDGEPCDRIENSHAMPEFFMSMASAGNHWLFISSRGAITAGRGNADQSLFPYLPADRLSDLRQVSGSRTLIRVPERLPGGTAWQPFSGNAPLAAGISQSVYKNSFGNRLWLEERNESLGLLFREGWAFGKRFGFIRSCTLVNLRETPVEVRLLDGLQDLMPAGLTAEFQLRFSNLADAYRRNERLPASGIGLYCLGSIPTDLAIPNEALRATTVWQTGLGDATVLLHAGQISDFLRKGRVREETEIRGRRGAYLACQSLVLPPANSPDGTGPEAAGARWFVVADTPRSQSEVVELERVLAEPPELVVAELEADIADNSRQLLRLLSAADGRQAGKDRLRTQRHQNNVLFNIMRGGLPVDGYRLHRQTFLAHVRHFNNDSYARNRAWLEGLSWPLRRSELLSLLESRGDPDLLRLGHEFLPFGFSRRHGDPTRPWNRFNIENGEEAGRLRVHYEGNWRDIFQNWEALALAWPEFLPAMVFRFVNASTADGYNPYRLTHEGFEWEEPESGAWSNIGYWGDHQIVYLLRLLELAGQFDPAGLASSLRAECVFAEVPYRIASAEGIRRNPRATIEYDHGQAAAIARRQGERGADGRLLHDGRGDILRASLLEKLLLPALVKLSSLVPGGGIWLYTQRPEWNDANNALAGYGLSVVTVCHLHRYLMLLKQLVVQSGFGSLPLSDRLAGLMEDIRQTMARSGPGSDEAGAGRQRRQTVDALLQAGDRYRNKVRDGAAVDLRSELPCGEFLEFLDLALVQTARTIALNRRPDGLYHSYNLLDYSQDGLTDDVRHLDLMLEGQVAALSSGILSVEQVRELLDALAASPLYRADQSSYLLQPDRELPGFLAKNVIPPQEAVRSRLFSRLLELGDRNVIERDARGQLRFHADFRNAADLAEALERLRVDPRLASLVDEERALVSEIHEAVFRHREFTGRSGSFFAYEGLGSIYWHLVSKLHLAIQENLFRFRESAAGTPELASIRRHYDRVGAGLGLHKSPAEYGGFSTDPYSHTPRHAGVQQPGMTGQVKEDILVRFAELGVRLNAGVISFDPWLFRDEYLASPSTLEFVAVDGELHSLSLRPGSFAFTFCQVPVVYSTGDQPAIRIRFADGKVESRTGNSLTAGESRLLTGRTGQILAIEVTFCR